MSNQLGILYVKDNQNYLSWEEWVRLNDVQLPHVLEMQDIILKQEERIRELENVLDGMDMLLHSFDFTTVDMYLDDLSKTATGKDMDILVALTNIIDNFKLRIYK